MFTLFLMFLVALSPIIWLVIALTKLKMPGYIASVFALLLAFVLSMLVWGMPIFLSFTAALEGFAMALWPIIIVILAAVFTYNLTVYSGAMTTIKSMLTSVSDDQRILVLLIVWGFGGFLEGMAGFGTAIAIPASMLITLGFRPSLSILVSLIANGMPTMFGSIGIPTVTLANLTGLDPLLLGFIQTIQAAPLIILSPFLMVILTGGGVKALKGVKLITLVSGLSFLLPQMFVARFVGAELAVVVGSLSSLFTTFFMAKYRKVQNSDDYKLKIEIEKQDISFKKGVIAAAPFLLIFVLLLATSKLVPFINEPLTQIRTSIRIYMATDSNPYTFTWIATPGFLIFVSGFLGGLIQGVSLGGMLHVLINTVKQMSKTMITMLSVLGTAKIMGYSGMISSIATFLVSLMGVYYPLVAPLLGALGTFVTGSGTSSSVLFGSVQYEAATAIGANQYWVTAANSLGVGAGKMLSPQSIAIGCAATSLVGKDGEILKQISKFAFVYLLIMACIVFFGQPLVNLFI